MPYVVKGKHFVKRIMPPNSSQLSLNGKCKVLTLGHRVYFERYRIHHTFITTIFKGRYDMSPKKQPPDSETCGIMIPIGVLLIVYLGTGIIFLLIPVFVLIITLLSSLNINRAIHRKKAVSQQITNDTIESYPQEPIYDQWQRKEEGTSLGILIPIFIIGLFYVQTGFSWPFLIPLFVLVTILIGDLVGDHKRGKRVRTALTESQGRTLSEVAYGEGLSEDQAIKETIHEKRLGNLDVWFDPSTGEIVDNRVHAESSTSARRSCIYCGFSLRDDDRFCPYCGAPIRVE